MTLEEIKKVKEEYGFTCQMIADASGVPMSTVLKIMSGKNKSPRYSTMEKLNRGVRKLIQEDRIRLYVKKFAEVKKTSRARAKKDEENKLLDENLVAEPKSSYGRKEKQDYNYGSSAENRGEKTIEDYLALPEGERVEMIDGVFYDMASPTSSHQDVVGFIYRKLCDHIDKNNGQCRAFAAPLDVQLSREKNTIVQPDVFVLCDKNKLEHGRVVGAPDFVIEVVSPSNKLHDYEKKLGEYRRAGVREYWIVDIDNNVVITFFFEADRVAFYSFEDKVPVGIWDGKCKVDFKAVKKYMEW